MYIDSHRCSARYSIYRIFLYVGMAQFLDENPGNNVIFPGDPIPIALAAISGFYFFGVVTWTPIKIL